MQHALITAAIATERQHDLRAEGRAAGRNCRSRTPILGRLRVPRRAPRTDAGRPCLEPRTAG